MNITGLASFALFVSWQAELIRCQENTKLFGYFHYSFTVWIQDVTGLGFSVEYPTITMHAISRDRSSFESECLFAVLDIALEGIEQNFMLNL